MLDRYDNSPFRAPEPGDLIGLLAVTVLLIGLLLLFGVAFAVMPARR
ncbi:hypothetical protein [Oryzicola mucosus]|uniref:Uncharacterized protein n=1 Tax=Oryzicola mucosus TaxID=2767425 RepID=A0A8J6PPJ7_9HYPH|nr:hypothetical protein [Oryzicola mucosus]MBD0417501.1 hypothetical protein [Oryzicola mucosus]